MTDMPFLDEEIINETLDDLNEEVLANEPEVVQEQPSEETVKSQTSDTKEPAPTKYQYVNPNVTMTHDPRKPYVATTEAEKKRTPLGILSLTGSELTEVISQQKFKNDSSVLSEEYIEALQSATELARNDDVLDKAVSYGKDLVQSVEFEDRKLHATVPSYKARSGDTLTGIRAVAQMQRATKQGSFLNFPCWASGVWLTLRAPTTFDLADNYDSIAEEIIELGKKTGGAIYGNSSVYLARYLMDLVEKLVHDCSIKDFASKGISLRDVLVVDDLQTIAWALAVCMYPNGYPFEEPCMVDIEKCTAIHRVLLNISKMFWVDKSRLTHWQQQFMSNKTIERSLDEIRKYQSEAVWLHSQSKGYEGGFKILIKTPTIAEHIDAGYTWIEEIETSVRAVLNNLSDSKLNTYVMERAGLTWLRQYSHYVKAVVYDNGSTVNKRADIDATLNVMCTEPEMVTKFNADMDEHISSNSISFIALPRYKCPSCQKDTHADETQHPHLIPIDGLQLFFVLRDQKLQLA